MEKNIKETSIFRSFKIKPTRCNKDAGEIQTTLKIYSIILFIRKKCNKYLIVKHIQRLVATFTSLYKTSQSRTPSYAVTFFLFNKKQNIQGQLKVLQKTKRKCLWFLLMVNELEYNESLLLDDGRS